MKSKRKETLDEEDCEIRKGETCNESMIRTRQQEPQKERQEIHSEGERVPRDTVEHGESPTPLSVKKTPHNPDQFAGTVFTLYFK